MTEAQYLTQQYEEDENVGEELSGVERNNQVARHILTEDMALVAAIRQRHNIYAEPGRDAVHEVLEWLDKCVDDLERQRDDLAAALRKIQSDAPTNNVGTDNYWKQMADKMGDIAARALARLEGGEHE